MNELLGRIKTSKLFNRADAFILAAAALVIVLCFLFPAFLRGSEDGFNIYYRGEKVMSFYYNTEKYDVFCDNTVAEIVVSKSENGIYVITIKTESGFNELTADCVKKSVKMTDADCNGNDCVYLPAVKGDGAIICMPHNLKILPLSDEVPLITGAEKAGRTL